MFFCCCLNDIWMFFEVKFICNDLWFLIVFFFIGVEFDFVLGYGWVIFVVNKKNFLDIFILFNIKGNIYFI